MRGSKGQASHRSRLLTADRERKSTHENMTTTLTKNSAVEPLAPRCLPFFPAYPLCSYIIVSQAPPRSLCYYCYMHIGYFYIIPLPFPSYRQSPCCGCSACVFYVALPFFASPRQSYSPVHAPSPLYVVVWCVSYASPWSCRSHLSSCLALCSAAILSSLASGSNTRPRNLTSTYTHHTRHPQSDT